MHSNCEMGTFLIREYIKAVHDNGHQSLLGTNSLTAFYSHLYIGVVML